MAQNVRNLQPGEYLCLQGEDSNEIYVLKGGKLEIYVVDAEGVVPQDRVESEGLFVGEVAEAGAFIGEIGAILNEPRSASMRVSADGPAQVMVIPLQGKGFAQTVVGNPKIGFSLSKTIAQRIGKTSESITKSDAMSMQVKSAMEHYAHEIFNMVSLLATAVEKSGQDSPLLNDAKNTIPYQIGRMVEKYGSVPTDAYTALGLPFTKHDEAFHNRVFVDKPQPGGQEAPEPTGPPKPGVVGFEPGSVVCPEKSVDEKMYILLAGRLEMFVGTRAIESIKMKGDIFGENAMFGGMERSTGIRALTEVHAMPLQSGQIEAFLMKKPAVMVHVLRSFARRLPLLNETLLTTVTQMNQIMNLLGHGPEGCLTTLETLVPRIKEETSALGAEAAPVVDKAEGLLGELSTEFEETNGKYEALCQEIGYKPAEGEAGPSAPRLAPPKFEFSPKVEQVEMLDVEHVNFIFNPKKDTFRACALEYDHESLMKVAKVPDASKKDFIWGRIHNIGESFPIQFITLDLDCGGNASHDRDYAMRAVKHIVDSTQQEAAMLFKEGRCSEFMYIPDHIKIEGDEVVDEATINEVVEAFKKKPDDRDNLDKLNGLFWDMVIGTVQKRLPRVQDNVIPFEESDLKLINFGLLDEQFLPNESNVLSQIEEDKTFQPPEGQEIRYIYLSEWLQDMYKEAFGYNKHLDMVEEQKEVENRVKTTQERVQMLLKGRAQMVASFPGGNAAAQFVQKYDGLIRGMAVLDRKMKAGKSISNEERGKIVQAKNAKTALQNQISKFLTTIKGKVSEDQIKQFTDMGDELEKKVVEVLAVQEELAKKQEEVKMHEKEMKTTTIKTKETAYKNEIIRIKKYVLLTAKKSKVDPTAVLVNVRDIATKKRIAEVLELFMSEEVDPEIFDPRQPRIKQLGIPGVMLVPGTGVSVYDWEKHVFMVPLVPPKSLEESIANAFVEFHWDMDEDKSMRESYGELKIYKKLSITKLKQQLAKDYMIWATQESKGWKKLDKEARTWFKVKIAKQKVDDKN